MSPYPNTPEAIAATALLGGPALPETPHHISSQFARVYGMYGTRDLDQISKNAAVAGPTPWPTAGKTKKGPAYSREHVAAALSQPPDLQPVDPRNLHSTQSGITRPGVDYYLNDPQYHQTGTTYADQANIGNRHPVVYDSESTGRSLILSGHHRFGSALLAGKTLNAIRVKGP